MKSYRYIAVAVLVLVALAFGSFYFFPLYNYQSSQSSALEGGVSYFSTAKSLENGQAFQLSAGKVAKEISGRKIEMFGYNSQVPGPLLKVNQGDSINLSFQNNIGEDTTVHWHGIRLDNQFDGVPGVTQPPVSSGGSFLYELDFPDPGLYWYHPHIREDKQQELGLYGGILVEPSQGYYNQANMEEVIFLDDIDISNGQPLFYDGLIDHALMGRFGSTMLLNGRTDYKLRVKKGEVVRLYFANAANSRVFNVSIPGVKLKLVGSDNGAFEKESFVDSIVVSPSERYIVEALFDSQGVFEIKNINPIRGYTMGKVEVSQETASQDFSADFYSLRENSQVKASIDEFRPFFGKEPGLALRFDVQMAHRMSMMEADSHGIEWEDTMGMMNSHMTDSMTKWIIEDMETKEQNMDISMEWKQGDKVKIRLFNDPTSPHPMQHPIHFHGQRFLVLEKDGVKNTNLAWKDTVLVPSGSTVDILLDASNPGTWMAHCHIAEHLHSGMMAEFIVSPQSF